MKSNYKVRALHFLQEIWPEIENYLSDPCECQRILDQYNARKSRKVRVCFGAVRVAFITSDYVIKYDYDPEEAKCFGGCYEEAEFYAFAKEQGFAHLFAESSLIVFNNRTFSIMPRIYGIGRRRTYVQNFLYPDDRNFVDCWLEDLHEENYGWKNGYPVIIDYACNQFCACMCEDEEES